METDELFRSVNECLTNPVSDILQNFSLEKSKTYYEKWAKQWNAGDYKSNPANKVEEVSFAFASLSELSWNATQAQNLYNNLKKEEFNRGVEWYIYGHNVVVQRNRLKSFDEWLHDGLKDALIMAYDCPEDWARKIIERKLWAWNYTNTQVHMFAEWKINKEKLKRLWHYEKYQVIEWRNLEEDIEEAKKKLEESNVTVLKLKM